MYFGKCLTSKQMSELLRIIRYIRLPSACLYTVTLTGLFINFLSLIWLFIGVEADVPLDISNFRELSWYDLPELTLKGMQIGEKQYLASGKSGTHHNPLFQIVLKALTSTSD